MFDNIGGKIKTLAVVLCMIGIASSVIFALVLWAQNSRYNSTVALGFGVLIGGALSSWIGSFFTYGFGELIEETSRNRAVNEEIRALICKQNKYVLSEEERPVRAQAPARMDVQTKAASSDPNAGRCKSCGKKNPVYEQYCSDCGEFKYS